MANWLTHANSGSRKHSSSLTGRSASSAWKLEMEKSRFGSGKKFQAQSSRDSSSSPMERNDAVGLAGRPGVTARNREA